MKKTASKSASKTGTKATVKATPTKNAGRGASTSRTPAKKTAAPSRSVGKSKAATNQSSSKEDLEKVMKETLKDVYYAEKQLLKALGKMSKAASNQDLKAAFDTHKQETEGQIEKLEEAFESLGMRATAKKCPAMDGLIKEGAEAIEEYDKGPARDAALIVAAQKAEHYEISAYGSLHIFAEILGYDECATIFEEIKEEEAATDEKLTEVAHAVNAEAAGEDEETADEDVEEEEMEEA